MKKVADSLLRTLFAAVIYIILLTPFIKRLRLEAALFTFVGFLIPVFLGNFVYELINASRSDKA